MSRKIERNTKVDKLAHSSFDSSFISSFVLYTMSWESMYRSWSFQDTNKKKQLPIFLRRKKDPTFYIELMFELKTIATHN